MTPACVSLYAAQGRPPAGIGVLMIQLESVLPVVLPGLALLLWHLRARHRFTVGRLVMAGGFTLYLLLVSKYTLFPLWFDSEYIEEARRQTRFLDGVNLVPFKGWSPSYLLDIQGWGNVALGVPFGFLYPFVMPVAEWRQIARYGLAFPVIVELTQGAISLCYGFTYRIVDINDVLLNFTGVVLGYAILRIVAFLFKKSSTHGLGRSNHPNDGILSHIRSVLLTC